MDAVASILEPDVVAVLVIPICRPITKRSKGFAYPPTGLVMVNPTAASGQVVQTYAGNFSPDDGATQSASTEFLSVYSVAVNNVMVVLSCEQIHH